MNTQRLLFVRPRRASLAPVCAALTVLMGLGMLALVVAL